MTKQLLKYAKLAPQIVRAAGLFRSVKPGSRAQRLEVEYEAQGLQFRFMSPFLLGVDDMRVMQGIVAIACAQNPKYALDLDGTGDDQFVKIDRLLAHTLDVQTTYDELARTIGYDAAGSSADTTIRNALERFFTVSVFIQPAGRRVGHTFEAGHIFERLTSADANRRVTVKLCPLLAFAVLGGPGTYMRDDLVEARKLKTDTTRLLHMQLAWLAPGNSANVGITTLVSYVYGNEPVAADTQRKRRARVIAAVKEIADELGWVATRNRSGYRITRSRTRSKTIPHPPAQAVQ